jgi:hypothetical protein
MIVILYINVPRCLIDATLNHYVEALWRLPINLRLMETKMSSPNHEAEEHEQSLRLQNRLSQTCNMFG